MATSREREQAGLSEPIPDDLHPAVLEGLAAAGIESLWAHQSDTLEAARRGHAIVTTGTASGKSLAFNLPVLDTLASDVAARAFYLYPTKALAQDQARGLARLATGSGGKYLRQAIYDGDTPREERRAIRQRSNLILTNPDMLHVGRSAEPPLVGRCAREPRLGRRGRGARVPRCVRLARGERAAPPAPARPRLRQRPAFPAHERHDREPDRARRAAHGSGGRSSWTATARPERSARSRCGTRRSWTSAWGVGPPRCPRPRTCWPSWSSARSGRSAS